MSGEKLNYCPFKGGKCTADCRVTPEHIAELAEAQEKVDQIEQTIKLIPAYRLLSKVQELVCRCFGIGLFGKLNTASQAVANCYYRAIEHCPKD